LRRIRTERETGTGSGEKRLSDKNRRSAKAGEAPAQGGSLAEHMAILKFYDERISRQMSILNRASEIRRFDNDTGGHDTDGGTGGSKGERGLPRRGPRILSNIQVAPPRVQMEVTPSVEMVVSPLGTPSVEEDWTEVRRTRRETPKETKRRMGRDSARQRPQRKETPRGVAGRQPPCIRRPLKNAVVAIKMEEDGISYAEALKRAKQKIDLKELSIKDSKIRLAANGGALVQVSGPEGHARADVLAVKLREAIGNGVRVTRPVKYGEIRISGIDPSITPTELVDKLANMGECTSDKIRLGPIRRTVRGIQSVWARCPLSAAFKLAELGNVELGWSVIRIELLRARPTQCYKCWHYGHVRVTVKVVWTGAVIASAVVPVVIISKIVGMALLA